MSKKIVIIVMTCVILFGICFSLGYIINNKKEGNDYKTKVEDDNSKEIIDDNTSQVVSNNKTQVQENKSEKVLINSKIGLDILKNFGITNVYSSDFYKLLDKEGLSDKVKRSWCFINVMQGNDYLYMLQYSSDSSYTYISESNLKEVIKNTFYESEDVLSGNLIYDFKFNNEMKRYEIPSLGVANANGVIIVEVPYDIVEYQNGKYEVYMYRIYLKQSILENAGTEEEQFASIITSIYYDDQLNNKACEIKDDDRILANLDGQREVLSQYIDSNKIEKSSILKIKYTIIKEGSYYKISDYSKI